MFIIASTSESDNIIKLQEKCDKPLLFLGTGPYREGKKLFEKQKKNLALRALRVL